MQYFSGLAGMRFFPADTPATALPRDAVVVSEQKVKKVSDLLALGYSLSMDEFGGPLAIAPVFLTSEDMEAQAREKRDSLLRNTDWIVLRASEQGAPLSPKVLAYRQALRDISNQEDYPQMIDWPTPPDLS